MEVKNLLEINEAALVSTDYDYQNLKLNMWSGAPNTLMVLPIHFPIERYTMYQSCARQFLI